MVDYVYLGKLLAFLLYLTKKSHRIESDDCIFLVSLSNYFMIRIIDSANDGPWLFYIT